MLNKFNLKYESRSSFIFLLLLFFGLVIRFYSQFLTPAFNVDEVHLALNIIQRDFFELFRPLDYWQSAPPGYLILNKFIIELNIFPRWIGFKLLSFIVSCYIPILFFRLIQKDDYSNHYFLPFIIILFNPWFVYNTLTLKQYGVDVLGILILVMLLKRKKRSNKLIFYFFLFWTFFSNIALFAIVGYSLFNLIKCKIFECWDDFFKDIILSFVSIIPYSIYYFWFINQEGASELKEYMMSYWSDYFFTFDHDFGIQLIAIINSSLHYFIDIYGVIGVLLVSHVLISLLHGLINRNYPILDNQYIYLLIIILFVHLGFSWLHIYPFFERTILYNIILILFLLVKISKQNTLYLGFSQRISIIWGITLCISYLTYSNFKENDIFALYKYVNTNNLSNIYMTNKVKENIVKLTEVTGVSFDNKFASHLHTRTECNSEYIISRAANKVHPDKTSNDDDILTVKNVYDLRLIKNLGGYNIYKNIRHLTN